MSFAYLPEEQSQSLRHKVQNALDAAFRQPLEIQVALHEEMAWLMQLYEQAPQQLVWQAWREALEAYYAALEFAQEYLCGTLPSYSEALSCAERADIKLSEVEERMGEVFAAIS